MGGYVGIPTSYTPVEYIESSGTQYIDTGIPASATLKTLCDMSTTTGGYPFGVTPAQNVKYYGAAVSATNQRIQSYFGTTNSYTIVNNIWTQGQRFVLTANDNYKFYKDSTQIADYTTGTTKEFDSSLPITIFALNGLYLSSRITMKLYGFKMYDNGTLVRDFVPVLDNNNVACLYDLVEGKLYYNKGTGSFVAGSATGQSVSIGSRARNITKAYVGIPTSYTPVEYIESSGTQYIDTGYKMSNNSKIVAKLSMADANIMTAVGVSGSYQSFSIQSYNGNYRIRWRSGTTSNIQVDSSIPIGTEPHIFEVNSTNAKIDGTVIGNTSSYQFTENSNLFICAMSSNNSPLNLATGRIYYYQIYDSNTLVRDFISATDQDGVACLYEQVEGKFYYNKKGASSFAAGSATGQTVSLGNKAKQIKKGYVGVGGVARLCFEVDTELQYIQTTGMQFINTGIVAKSTTCIETKFQITTSSTGMSYLCGCYQNGSGGNRMYVGGTTSNGYITFATTSNAWDNLFTWTQSEVTLIYNDVNRQIVWNGTPVAGKTAISLGDANTQTIGLFSINPPEGTRWKCKMFYFKISNRTTGDVLMELIPIIRHDGVVCFYDKVSKNYFENQGSGDFVAGPKKMY